MFQVAEDQRYYEESASEWTINLLHLTTETPYGRGGGNEDAILQVAIVKQFKQTLSALGTLSGRIMYLSFRHGKFRKK